MLLGLWSFLSPSKLLVIKTIYPLFVTLFYAYFVFFMLEFWLGLAVFFARALELSSSHNSTSLKTLHQYKTSGGKDGISWCLIVYLPGQRIFGHLIPQKWVSVPVVFVTFLVSGIRNEVYFYYLGDLDSILLLGK